MMPKRQQVSPSLPRLIRRGGLQQWFVPSARNPVTRKLLAHTMGVWLNLRQGRDPLGLDGLLAA